MCIKLGGRDASRLCSTTGQPGPAPHRRMERVIGVKGASRLDPPSAKVESICSDDAGVADAL